MNSILNTLAKTVYRNWKTSSAGVLTAFFALMIYYKLMTIEGAGLWMGLAVALGFLISKDGDAPKVDKPEV